MVSTAPAPNRRRVNTTGSRTAPGLLTFSDPHASTSDLSSPPSRVSNSRRLGLISRGAPQWPFTALIQENLGNNSRTRRNGHAEHLANPPRRPFLDLVVTRDGRVLAGGRPVSVLSFAQAVAAPGSLAAESHRPGASRLPVFFLRGRRRAQTDRPEQLAVENAVFTVAARWRLCYSPCE